VNGDDVPDQLLEFFGRRDLLLLQKGEVFPQADLVAVHLECVQPHAMLWDFRIVELGGDSIGDLVGMLGAEQKVA
jgi:hypothetical protein